MTTAELSDHYRAIETVDVRGKRVIVRSDLNVPMAGQDVADATRIERLVPTLRGLAERGATIIVLSHLGRPDGEARDEFSLRPVARKLASLMNGIPVSFAEDCVGPQAHARVREAKAGEVVVLENVRFHKGEEANDPGFAHELASHGDLYVNDAFSVSHRAHASTDSLARLLPAYAGPSMMAEINAFKLVLDRPDRPVAAIVGGSKISTKIDVLVNLVKQMDYLFIGGGMANTFLLAEGYAIGKSLHEPSYAETVDKVMSQAAESGCKIVLPVDAVVAHDLKEGAPSQVVSVGEVPGDRMILDIGPASVADFVKRLEGCRTLLWNGPVGAFETAPFGEGTFALAREVARLTRENGLVSVAGGGDTVAALNAAGVIDDFTYVSMAGGAFLEWLEGRKLPGVVALIRT